MARPRKQPAGEELRVLELANLPPAISRWRRMREQPGRPTRIRRVLDRCPHDRWLTWSDLGPTGLPSHDQWHIRGFIAAEFVNFRISESFLPRIREHSGGFDRLENMFHSQPTASIYSDIPSREDIYLFFKLDLLSFINVGKTQIGILERGEGAAAAATRLREWEATHPYHIARLAKRRWNAKLQRDATTEELFCRYTYAALRGIGLSWPDKPAQQRVRWAALLRDMGISVRILDRNHGG